MTDKQQIVQKDKQFRELHQFLNDLCDKKVVKICGTIPLAEALYNAGYRRVPENAVVLTREEYGNIKLTIKSLCDTIGIAEQETAKEILKWLVDAGVINTAPDTTKMYFKERFGVEVEE